MRKPWVILLGITLLGALLRLFILSQRGSMWFDEAFSVHFASMDLSRMWSYLKFENNPPLYFALLHFWMKLFGNSELAVRILSMIFGVASIPLVYVLGKRLRSSSAGLFAAFLTAISTFQIFYSTETRMYTLYLVLTLLAMWLFVRHVERSETRSAALRVPLSRAQGPALHYIALFFVLSLLIWTHITAWLIVLALGIYLLWQSKFSVKQFIIHNSKFLILGTLLVLQFLPWIINFVQLKIIAPLSQGYFFYIPPDKNYFLSILEIFLVFGQDNAFIVTLVSVLMVGLLWFALRRPWTAAVKLLLCWLTVPLLVGFAFSNAIPRYFIAAAPALYLLLGTGLANLVEWCKEKLPKRQCYVLCVMCYVLFFALIFPDYPSLAQLWPPKWDKLANWIGERELGNAVVLVNPHSEVLPFERYYKGNLPVVGFYPKDDELDRDMRIVRTNWISLNTKENVPRLRDVTAGYETVFLVTGGVDPIGRNLVPIWFWENGWRRAKAQEFGRISVMQLTRH